MQFEVLARFVLGVLLGATIWAVSHRSRADSIPATANTQTQAATSSVVLQYAVNGYQATVGWFNSPAALMGGYVGWRNGQHLFCSRTARVRRSKRTLRGLLWRLLHHLFRLRAVSGLVLPVAELLACANYPSRTTRCTSARAVDAEQHDVLADDVPCARPATLNGTMRPERAAD